MLEKSVFAVSLTANKNQYGVKLQQSEEKQLGTRMDINIKKSFFIVKNGLFIALTPPPWFVFFEN